MGLMVWVLIIATIRILIFPKFVGTQFATSLLHQPNESHSFTSFEVSTANDPSRDLLTSNLGIDEVLSAIVNRYRKRVRDRMEPRMLNGESITDKRIIEICGTSSSIECGAKVLHSIDVNSAPAAQDEEHYKARCDLRKKFLECIDNQRRSCKKLAEGGVFPILPHKSKIQETQEKVWKTLWTSGGCILGI